MVAQADASFFSVSLKVVLGLVKGLFSFSFSDSSEDSEDSLRCLVLMRRCNLSRFLLRRASKERMLRVRWIGGKVVGVAGAESEVRAESGTAVVGRGGSGGLSSGRASTFRESVSYAVPIPLSVAVSTSVLSFCAGSKWSVRTFGHLRIGLGMVRLDTLRVRLDSLLPRIPVRRANLTVLIRELERIQQPQRLIHGPTHRQIIDRDLPDHTIGIDQEQTTQGDTLLLDQNTVVLGELVVLVCVEWDVDGAETAVAAAGLRPGEERVLGVGGGEDDGGVAGFEVLDAVAEGDDFGGADEGPGHGDKAEDEPLLVVGVSLEGDVCGVLALGDTQKESALQPRRLTLKGAINDSSALESRSGLLDAHLGRVGGERHCEVVRCCRNGRRGR